jgi:hypothetical protein
VDVGELAAIEEFLCFGPGVGGFGGGGRFWPAEAILSRLWVSEAVGKGSLKGMNVR